MKKLLSLPALALVSVCAAPAAFSATADEAAQAAGSFDVGLATVLIVVICSVLGIAILTLAVILAKRNIHN